MLGLSRHFALLFAVSVLLAAGCGQPPPPVNPGPRDISWYHEQYPFARSLSRPFTFETEFVWPEGYGRPDSSKLNSFQFWISNLQLWPNNYGVGSRLKGRVFSPGEICRTVRLPWRTLKFTDRLVPLQLVAEYYLARGKEYDLYLLPTAGDTITYDRWLKSYVTYGAGRMLQFNEDTPREASDGEFDKFIDLCANNVTYGSLISNCVPVEPGELAPGDLIVGHDERGLDGKVYIIVCMLANRKGDRLFATGTACDFGCDLHIPLVGKGPNDPWQTLEQIRGQVGEWDQVGFYRLRLSTEQ